MPIGDVRNIGQRRLQTHALKREEGVPKSTSESSDAASNIVDARAESVEQPSAEMPKSFIGKLGKRIGDLFRRQPPVREWTVLFYANGNSDLENRELEKLHKLGEAGSSKTTTLLAQVSHGSRGGIGERYEVAKKSWGDVTTGPGDLKRQEDLGKVNVGSGQTFTDALLWAHEKYPAKQYMVIFGGHGEGPRGALHDDIHGDKLTPQEIAQGFQALKDARGGKSAEVVLADSCLLGTGEVEYQMKDVAQYYIASQEVIQTSDINFRDLGKGMKKRGLDAKDATEVVMKAADSLTRTLSVVDLSKMDGLGKAMKQFNTALESSEPVDRLRLNKLAQETQDFMKIDDVPDDHPFKSYRDLGHFAQLVRNDESLANKKLRQAADSVFKAVGQAVVQNHTTPGYENSHGISMNIADAQQAEPGSYYGELALAQETGWSGSLGTEGVRTDKS